jgi:RNA polymerase sigma factor (sigma-70 family)
MSSNSIESRSVISKEIFPPLKGNENDHARFKNYSDQQLWSEFSNGSETAFAHIYSRFFSLLFNYGIKVVSNRQLVSDCIQELFIDIWNSRLRLKEVEWLKTYLIKSLRRRVFKELKNENSVHQKPLEEDYSFQVELSHDIQLIQKEDRSQQIKRLNLAMTKLTDRQKEAIFLKFYERLTYDQLAGVMDISTKAAYKIMARAVDVLKKAHRS